MPSKPTAEAMRAAKAIADCVHRAAVLAGAKLDASAAELAPLFALIIDREFAGLVEAAKRAQAVLWRADGDIVGATNALEKALKDAGVQ